MKLRLSVFVLTASILTTLTAQAQVLVQYDPTAPEGNFGSPTGYSDNVAYTISLTADATNVYVNLQTDPALGAAAGYTGLDFTNLYFSTNVVSGSGGSTLGFEIENNDAFIPGVAGSVSTAGDGFSVTHTTGDWSISIPWTYFETDPDSLGFTTINATNDVLRLNLSQSFGYSVAGGEAAYGDTRLGEVVVPEPSTYALVMGSLAALLFVRRFRRA